MRPLVAKITPRRGFSPLFYVGYNVLLPILVFLLVRIDVVSLAIVLIFISKWRMFFVRPRYWLVNIRANSVDMIVGLSVLAFMVHAGSEWLQLIWVVLWIGWLLLLKPAANVLMVSLQALVGFIAGLMALFLAWNAASLLILVLAVGVLCFLTAHHFLDSFDEPYTRLLSFVWGYFGAALTWVLGHWLLFYGPVAQITLLLVAIGFALGALYYLDHFDRLSVLVRRQIIFILLAVVLVVLTFSDWGDKIV